MHLLELYKAKFIKVLNTKDRNDQFPSQNNNKIKLDNIKYSHLQTKPGT